MGSSSSKTNTMRIQERLRELQKELDKPDANVGRIRVQIKYLDQQEKIYDALQLKEERKRQEEEYKKRMIREASDIKRRGEARRRQAWGE